MSSKSLFPFDSVLNLRRQRPPLASDAVHLWLVDLDALGPIASALSANLSSDERETAHRLVSNVLRRRYLLAHGVVRYVLSAYLEVPPAEIRLIRSPTGKPSLDQHVHERIFFNLSHCQGAALIAVTEAGDVGVDIEQRRPIPEMLEIARDHFGPMEHQQIRATPADCRDALFFQLWTRKEALVKLAGAGLGAPLQALPDCSTLSFRPSPGFFAAAAVRHPKATWVMLPDPGGEDGARLRG